MSLRVTADIFDSGSGKAFVVKVGGVPVLRSDSDNYVFLGEYGTYASAGVAQRAALEMIARNKSFMNRLAESEGVEGIKSLMVDKYVKTLKFFQDLYRKILQDENNHTYNNLDISVPALNKMIEDVAGDGGELDLVIDKIEKSTRLNYDPLEDGYIEESEVHGSSAKYLVRLRDAMREIMEALKNDYSELLEASSSGMAKYASCDMEDMFGEVVRHYAHTACKSCGIDDAKIENAVNFNGNIAVVCNSCGKKVIVVVGEDLCYRGIIPASGQMCPYSMRHYLEMLKPSIAKIGHIRPMGHDNIIMRSDSSVMDGDDIYSGMDVNSRRPVSVVVSPVGGKRTSEASFSFVVKELKSASSNFPDNDLNNLVEKIRKSPLVMIDNPRSRYHEMAGTVDPDRILMRNDHIEFPVSLKYDNGMETELWVTNEDVKAYR